MGQMQIKEYTEEKQRGPVTPMHRKAMEVFKDCGMALSHDVMLASWLTAMQVPVLEIEMQLGMPAGWVYGLKQRGEFREAVRRCVRYMAERKAEEAQDIDELFNKQVVPSALTLMEIRDNPFTKDADRLKAATEFLDRAASAPKATKQVDERRVVIALPASEFRNMQQALLDSGEPEDIEVYNLLKGRDFAVAGEEGAMKEEEEEGTGESYSEVDEIPVVEIR